jgi:hypothetical protein
MLIMFAVSSFLIFDLVYVWIDGEFDRIRMVPYPDFVEATESEVSKCMFGITVSMSKSQ